MAQTIGINEVASALSRSKSGNVAVSGEIEVIPFPLQKGPQWLTWTAMRTASLKKNAIFSDITLSSPVKVN